MVRRDRQLDQESNRQNQDIYIRKNRLNTHQKNTERALYRMERALKETRNDPEPAPERPPKTAKKGLLEVDIFAISAQIDKIIDEKNHPERQLEVEKLKEQIPESYHGFVDVFLKSASDTLPPRRENDYRIELTDKNTLGYSPLYRYSAKELEAIKAYLIENLQKGFIVSSAAPFGSPVLMAAKPGGGLRFCVDYWKLNSIIKKNRYPLPLMDELLDRLDHAKIFIKLDIRQGFYRIRMHPDSVNLTTFRTKYGFYKYQVLPFGLTNGPAAFQQLINDIFIDLIDKYVTVYVNDILIFSENELEHEAHVQEVLKRLRAAGLQAAIHKCEFNVKRTKFLGFILTPNGIEVDPEKVAVITNWQIPTTVRGVQSFLGFCNFYRRFIEAYSRIARPLIETDISDGVVAGIFSQLFEGRWHPIAYFSRNMLGAERNYDIHDKELLAIVRALELWRTELEGLQTTERIDIWTDHRALEYFMTTKKLNGRQARWLEFLSRFHFMIKFRPGLKNAAADALSRPEESPLDLDTKNQALLRPEWLEEGVLPPQAIEQELSAISALLAPIELDDIQLMDRLLQANRTATDLDEEKAAAAEEGSE
ncbi:retrovirus polyprotein [Aspergillus affinis]|uniref:retrovirus polyprotein n=1 Tax=Aspergillus affinis TaxID=1070780 RepID=UPI0022FDE016|nr:retrovirus polyprotein [Aspergillus affinis]KAI9035170.1 retrovirus polyprotein [Aspergillus affinis]